MPISRTFVVPCTLLLLTALLLFPVGCASTPRPNTPPVHITVGADGLLTYGTLQFRAEQLPEQLSRNGVSKDQDIRLHLADAHQTNHLAQLSDVLKRNGYKRFFFMTERRATAEVTGQSETRTPAAAEAPPASTTKKKPAPTVIRP
jgi:biopolymer transport protein ExbD